MMSNALDIEDLFFQWDKKNKFSLKIKKLSIKKNKKIIMFGESGSGKSTLLNLISGIISPVSGKIVVKNKVINNLPQNKKDKFRANNIGVIFQQFNILEYISPIQNILPKHFRYTKEGMVNNTGREKIKVVCLGDSIFQNKDYVGINDSVQDNLTNMLSLELLLVQKMPL